MDKLIAWFRRTFFISENRRRLNMHLSAEQAIKLARIAAADDPLSETLTMATLADGDGPPVWIVTAAVMGRALVVEIDDGTGRVLKMERVGLR